MTPTEDFGTPSQPESLTSTPMASLDPATVDARTNTTSDAHDKRRSHEDHHLQHRTVDLDFFDPSGVAELRRSMSRASAGHGRTEPSQLATMASALSEDTLIPENGPFDLEKAARVFNRK